MKLESYSEIMECVTEDDVIEAMNFRKEKKNRKGSRSLIAGAIAAALVCANLAGGYLLLCTKDQAPTISPNVGTTLQTDHFEILTTTSQSQTTAQTTTNQQPAETIKVAERLYRVLKIPSMEEVELPCVYGRLALFSNNSGYLGNQDTKENAFKVQAYDRIVDFSKAPICQNTGYVNYCIMKDSVIFADYQNVYRSDLDFQSPQIIFQMNQENSKYDLIDMKNLIALLNYDKLFFMGTKKDGSRFCGSLDPITGDVTLKEHSYFKEITNIEPCNLGVVMYSNDVLKKKSSTVLYWERGKLYEIPLKNPRESEFGVQISANGQYLYTYLEGKTQEGRLTVRCSVYDVKSGEFMNSFDWTFQMYYDASRSKGFSFAGIHEETQSLYLVNLEDLEAYRFHFGEESDASGN